MGMRQRYLLGRYYYETYLKGLKTLENADVSDLFQIASTNVNRTIQSAGAQFLGFTHELRKEVVPKLTPAQ